MILGNLMQLHLGVFQLLVAIIQRQVSHVLISKNELLKCGKMPYSTEIKDAPSTKNKLTIVLLNKHKIQKDPNLLQIAIKINKLEKLPQIQTFKCVTL